MADSVNVGTDRQFIGLIVITERVCVFPIVVVMAIAVVIFAGDNRFTKYRPGKAMKDRCANCASRIAFR